MVSSLIKQHQGAALSPPLFIIVIEALSKIWLPLRIVLFRWFGVNCRDNRGPKKEACNLERLFRERRFAFNASKTKILRRRHNSSLQSDPIK